MVSGTFLLVLHAHLPYVLNHGRSPHGSQWLCEAAAHCYLPLLATLRRLVDEGVSPRLTIDLSPVLCEQLASRQFQKELGAFLEARLATCQQNRVAFREQGQVALAALTGFWEAYYQERSTQFGQYGGDLLARFRELEAEGHLELMTCAATHGYLPLFSREETIALQLDQAIVTHEHHFGRKPRGIWLPECAYRPRYEWSPPVGSGRERLRAMRPGLEEQLAARGLNYFFTDTHMVSGGMPASYYHELYPALEQLGDRDRYEYEIVRRQQCTPYESYWVVSPGGVGRAAVFARDQKTTLQVWSRELGYPGDGAYLDFHKQHLPGGLRYWRVTHPKAPLEEKLVYDPHAALAKTEEHARQFCELVTETLCRQQAPLDGQDGIRAPIVCACFDTELFGHWWFEGPQWLYHLYKALAASDVAVQRCSDHLALAPPDRTITLLEGSWGEGGDHRVWLNKATEWTWERLYEVEEEAWALRDRVVRQGGANGADSLINRLLTQTLRSFLLLCSSDWQFLITTMSARDYAEMRFARHYSEFKRLAQLTRQVVGGEPLTTEDEGFLARKESQDFLFPTIILPPMTGPGEPSSGVSPSARA